MKNVERFHEEAGLFVLRHGKSGANADKVIASQRDNGERAGLVGIGENQVKAAADKAPFNGFPVTVLTSPFKRCIDTAELYVAHAGLHVPNGIQVRHELVERDFGDLEGGDKKGYKLVYSADVHDPDSRAYGAESTSHVAERVGNLVANVYEMQQRQPVLFVTHADVGEIAESILKGKPANTHRQHVPKLQNAELRKLPVSAQQVRKHKDGK